LNLTAAACLKSVGTGQQKVGEVSGAKRKQLEEHAATSQLKWQQVSDMLGIKRAP